MGIDISPEHRDFVRQELASGRFSSEQELISAALDLLRASQREIHAFARTPGNGLASLKELILEGPNLEGIDLKRDPSNGREPIF